MLNYARRIFAESAVRVTPVALAGVRRHDIERVVVILSAARSGSTFLFEALCRTGQFVALPSEHTPLYKLAGLGREDLGLASDRLDSETSRTVAPARLDELFGYLALEICSGPGLAAATRAVIVGRMVRRLALQWPRLAIPHGDLTEICARAFDHAAGQGAPGAIERALFATVGTIADRCGRGDLGRYYDVPGRSGYVAAPLPPPDEAYVIEEPPFVIPRRGDCAPPAQSRPAAILLKASIDAYYFPLIAALFPKAEIKIVYLHRNPASAINGLVDGWSNGTFYSHNVGGEQRLEIAGYSERPPWNRSWWKFELPPGWKDLARQPLEAVCARQWSSANEAILDVVDSHPGPVRRVAYEQLVRDERSFSTTFAALLDFLRVESPSDRAIQLRDIPNYMATSRQRFFKWKDREHAILQQIANDGIVHLAKHLGYDISDINRKWI